MGVAAVGMIGRDMERRKLLIGVLLAAVAVVVVAYYRAPLAGKVVEIENWIGRLGIWGPVVYVGLFILLTSVFFPDSVLTAVAGALFGTLVGTPVVVVGALVTQSIAFAISRHFLQQRVEELIKSRPKFAAIRRAAERGSFRLQFLLRLTPLNPVIVSYVLGTTGSRFGVFFVACLGLVPALFVQVYCGYTAKHMIKAAGQVSQHSTLETVLVVLGLVACLLLFFFVTRLAQRAIAEAEQ
jgi:uncharacterized membrane protein YdjX (TVP38/TMEM64 family)